MKVDFTVEAPPTGGTCAAQSDVSALPVAVREKATGFDQLIGYSVGEARLELFGDQLNWTTPGFTFFATQPFLPPILYFGPWNFQVSLASLGINGSQSSFADIVRIAENYIHQQLSMTRFGFPTNYVIFEDPGETDLLISSPSGQRVGMTTDGSVLQEQPLSAYFPDIPLAIVFAPEPGSYDVRVTGRSTGSFELVSAVVADSRTLHQEILNTTIQEGEAISTQFSIAQRPFGDVDFDWDVDLQDLNTVRNSFGNEQVAVQGDANGDGKVALEDLNAVRNNFGMRAGFITAPPSSTSRETNSSNFDQSNAIDFVMSQLWTGNLNTFAQATPFVPLSLKGRSSRRASVFQN